MTAELPTHQVQQTTRTDTTSNNSAFADFFLGEKEAELTSIAKDDVPHALGVTSPEIVAARQRLAQLDVKSEDDGTYFSPHSDKTNKVSTLSTIVSTTKDLLTSAASFLSALLAYLNFRRTKSESQSVKSQHSSRSRRR
jgi:hypothetical protein